jgi:hypothetical protein
MYESVPLEIGRGQVEIALNLRIRNMIRSLTREDRVNAGLSGSEIWKRLWLRSRPVIEHSFHAAI